MIADCARGHTPELLGQYLRERFPERRAAWVPRWLAAPRTYDVSKVEPFDDGGWLRASCVFFVFTRDGLLEGRVLPSGGSFGLFALGPGGLQYLNRQPERLAELLRHEDLSLETCSPMVLAELVSEALGRDGNEAHAVLSSQEHLERYDGGLDVVRDQYQLNPTEWERVRHLVHAPAITGTKATGWQLEFCSLFGWMHLKENLVRHRFRLSGEYHIVQEQQILSRRIFKAVPGIRY